MCVRYQFLFTVYKEVSMQANLPRIDFISMIQKISLKRGAAFGFIIFGALIAFELFNFSTTEFALNDVLGGELRIMGISWAAILAIAFCGIDFAGIARLFTPERGRNELTEVWYLFGAWLLAAAMNATLTWWGVSVAIRTHQTLGAAVVGQDMVMRVVPIFVAVMVWVIRVLIIGTFSIAGERIFSMADDRPVFNRSQVQKRPASIPASSFARPNSPVPTPRPMPIAARSYPRQDQRISPSPVRPAPKPEPIHRSESANRLEPTYHPIGMAARPKDDLVVRR